MGGAARVATVASVDAVQLKPGVALAAAAHRDPAHERGRRREMQVGGEVAGSQHQTRRVSRNDGGPRREGVQLVTQQSLRVFDMRVPDPADAVGLGRSPGSGKRAKLATQGEPIAGVDCTGGIELAARIAVTPHERRRLCAVATVEHLDKRAPERLCDVGRPRAQLASCLEAENCGVGGGSSPAGPVNFNSIALLPTTLTWGQAVPAKLTSFPNISRHLRRGFDRILPHIPGFYGIGNHLSLLDSKTV